MTGNERRLILLGPQPKHASLSYALYRLAPTSPMAFITAGWETDESDDGALREVLGQDAVNLNLFARSEQLFADDPDLIQTLRARQDEFRLVRDVYCERLSHLLVAAREVFGNENPIGLDAEKESAIDMVRQLDRQYFLRTCQINDDYEARLQTDQRPHVVRHREELAKILAGVGGLVISGGHVAIILNRLKIFGILELNAEIPVIAWSGATMALANQIVFFHDSPPQGAGDPELLRAGMGMFHDLLPLPNAKMRLKLEDSERVKLFARRFNDFQCVVLDDQTVLDRVDGVWSVQQGDVNCLGQQGELVELQA